MLRSKKDLFYMEMQVFMTDRQVDTILSYLDLLLVRDVTQGGLELTSFMEKCRCLDYDLLETEDKRLQTGRQ